MKWLVVFTVVLAVAAGARSRWNLWQISDAIENPITNPSLIPVLEQALGAYMEAIFSGQDTDYISISTGAVDLSTWNLGELSAAIENPNTDPGLLPYLKNALIVLMDNIFSETVPSTTTVSIVIPSMDISHWTLQELDYALSHPNNPEMVPYLEQGLNKLMDAIWHGVDTDFVVLSIPVNIVDAVAPTPVAVVPEVVVTPVEVEPTPVLVADTPVSTASSPLVEIIVNINSKQNAEVTPEIANDPSVEPFENPRPPLPGFLENRPIPVEPEMNPIDVVAVAEPEINPVDLLNPVIVPVLVAGEHVDIGPM